MSGWARDLFSSDFPHGTLHRHQPTTIQCVRTPTLSAARLPAERTGGGELDAISYDLITSLSLSKTRQTHIITTTVAGRDASGGSWAAPLSYTWMSVSAALKAAHRFRETLSLGNLTLLRRTRFRNLGEIWPRSETKKSLVT